MGEREKVQGREHQADHMDLKRLELGHRLIHLEGPPQGRKHITEVCLDFQVTPNDCQSADNVRQCEANKQTNNLPTYP